MNINRINSNLNFSSVYTYSEVASGRKNFYELPVNEKLDVIYSIINYQKDDLRTISFNQKRILDFNNSGFKYVLLNDAEPYLPDESAVAKLQHAYDRNKINIIDIVV